METKLHSEAWYNRVMELIEADPGFLGALHASWAFGDSEAGQQVKAYFLETGDFKLSALDPDVAERHRAHEENHSREVDASIFRAMDRADAEGLT